MGKILQTNRGPHKIPMCNLAWSVATLPEAIRERLTRRFKSWHSRNVRTYLVLKEGSKLGQFQDKFKHTLSSFSGQTPRQKLRTTSNLFTTLSRYSFSFKKYRRRA